MVTRPGNADLMDIAIFAKAPQPGAAKTRLIPALSAAAAARLQRQLTLSALQLANCFASGKVTLHCAPDINHRFFRALRDYRGVSVCAQSGADLGARMAHAFAKHAGPLLLIGTDCPALQCMHLTTAESALRAGNDAVFIPAEDGGYVLIGLNRPHTRLFEDIDWGSERVMAQTRERLIELGLRWAEPFTLWDLDRPDDLQRLAKLGREGVSP
ncbi:TIGR04282 family arsenosugar biosynthesis glycosyltransferase [Propionivibrio sp.]|uniref:TIGR04282 family arsenosugar biosynthesis glycosyltransferase n=1 Tax=Propionivibrio sp. TaxID=2212460 RepID=UPI002639E4E5|nr:TIGR04282 family arsenosugar biosynthesis glycosyltransferase [Propionivibrio sp.]